MNPKDHLQWRGLPGDLSLIDVYLEATKEKGPDNIEYFIDTAQTGQWPMHVNWAQIFDIIQREYELAIAVVFRERSRRINQRPSRVISPLIKIKRSGTRRKFQKASRPFRKMRRRRWKKQ